MLSSRLLLVAVVLAVGILVARQNLGFAGPQIASGAPDAVAAASSPPQLEWALAGLVLVGSLITLLRPRRRKVIQVTDK